MSFAAAPPFLRILLPFAAGIVVAIQIRLKHEAVSCLMLFFFLSFFILVAYKRYYLGWLTGLVMQMLLFVLGYIWLCERSDFFRHNNLSLSDFPGCHAKWIAHIKEDPRVRAKTVQAVAFLQQVDGHAGETKWGRALLYLRKDSSSIALKRGAVLQLDGRLNAIRNVEGASFNYRDWLWRRGIFATFYANRSHWKFLAMAPGDPWVPVQAWKEHLRGRLHTSGLSPSARALCAALLLGDRGEMEADMRQAYTDAGVVHVLAVSGLHVGLLFAALSLVLAPLSGRYGWQWLGVALIWVVLWAYAAMTGLSPSVCRAATMFSFLAVGRGLRRKGSPLNTLAASAFVLLLFDPTLIMEAGFQLSYLAVAGILWLHRPLYLSIEIRSRWGNRIWNMAALSMVAQLATFPLILYYFGKFPTYFLIANIWVVPLVAVLLYGGVAVLLFGNIPVLGPVLQWVLDHLVWLMEKGIFWLSALPGSVAGIRISLGEMIVLYVFLAGFASYLLLPQYARLRFALVSLSVFLAVRIAGQAGLV